MLTKVDSFLDLLLAGNPDMLEFLSSWWDSNPESVMRRTCQVLDKAGFWIIPVFEESVYFGAIPTLQRHADSAWTAASSTSQSATQQLSCAPPHSKRCWADTSPILLQRMRNNPSCLYHRTWCCHGPRHLHFPALKQSCSHFESYPVSQGQVGCCPKSLCCFVFTAMSRICASH